MPTTGNATGSKPAPPVGTIPTETRPRHGGVFFGPRMRYPAGAVMMPRHFGKLDMCEFRNHLKSVGVADTRVWALAHAAESIHEAVCALDHGNRELLARHYPAFLQLAEEFGSFDETLQGAMGVDFNRATYPEINQMFSVKS